MRKRFIVLAIAVLALLVVAGCGGDDNKSTSGGGAATTAQEGAKKGGHLDVMSLSDVDSLDPGYWYYQYDYMALAEPTQRGLYGWEANKESPTPDLADGQPQITDGGKTVTIKIHPGLKYSPGPVKRTIKADDFKYALERCFNPIVGNGYVNSYFGFLSGLDAYKDGKAKEISGITAPDDNTLVMKFDKPQGAALQALALPCSVPVPREYAKQYDSGKQSTYGQHQVFTGPYMIKGSEDGDVKPGYVPGKKIELVRNPNWDKKSDFRPAYLDSITFLGGNDISVASRKILTGQGIISGDFAAPPTAVFKQALSSRKDQVAIIPAGSNRYIALNSAKKPFDNADLRKAVVAATNRNALIQTRGGPTIGKPATHLIPPGMGGFEEAGGLKGKYDFYAPDGNKASAEVIKKYMTAAGFPSGKYNGPEILMVGDDQPPASKTGEAFLDVLKGLGFNVRYRQVPHDVMYSKFCQVPKNEPDVCPNVGWGKDFFDAESMINPTFNGKNIVPSGNVNYPQLNDPEINKMMVEAQQLTDQAERDKAWAAIDDKITAGAYVVMWIWDNDVNIRSKNVNGVQNKFNASWDVTYTSLK